MSCQRGHAGLTCRHQCNVAAGWRFFHRHAELSAGVLNATDQNCHLSPLNVYSEAPRERIFFTQLKLQF